MMSRSLTQAKERGLEPISEKKMSLTENMVLESLKKLIDPNTDKNLVETKSVKSLICVTSDKC